MKEECFLKRDYKCRALCENENNYIRIYVNLGREMIDYENNDL
jgi:hypothetical protein